MTTQLQRSECEFLGVSAGSLGRLSSYIEQHFSR